MLSKISQNTATEVLGIYSETVQLCVPYCVKEVPLQITSLAWKQYILYLNRQTLKFLNMLLSQLCS